MRVINRLRDQPFEQGMTIYIYIERERERERQRERNCMYKLWKGLGLWDFARISIEKLAVYETWSRVVMHFHDGLFLKVSSLLAIMHF